jgi:hypothetical protein
MKRHFNQVMKTKLYVCTLTAALVAGFAGWGLSHGPFKVQAVKAANGFSAASVKGTYGYTMQGQIGTSTPLAGLGLLVMDGNGGLSGTETTQVYGVGMQTTSYQGSYTVKNDGSGTMTINYPTLPVDPDNPDAMIVPGVVARYNFVIVNGNAELKAARAENGTIAIADFKLQ